MKQEWWGTSLRARHESEGDSLTRELKAARHGAVTFLSFCLIRRARSGAPYVAQEKTRRSKRGPAGSSPGKFA